MSGKYRTILADPPWHYSRGMRGGPSRTHVGDDYPLLTPDAIAALPVADLAAEAAHLYLWAPDALLEVAYRVVRAWGFEPDRVIVWCKPGPGLGLGFRGNTEHLLIGRRGGLPFLTTAKGTWYTAPRGRHSAKPELFIDLVEAMSPAPRLELFARRQRLGWDVWGNETYNNKALTELEQDAAGDG